MCYSVLRRELGFIGFVVVFLFVLGRGEKGGGGPVFDECCATFSGTCSKIKN